jgi:hypothetical protein
MTAIDTMYGLKLQEFRLDAECAYSEARELGLGKVIKRVVG